jgi:hypothetical protein
MTNTTILNNNKTEQKNWQPKLLIRYIKSIEVMNKNTAYEYNFRLSHFEKFIFLSIILLWMILSKIFFN